LKYATSIINYLLFLIPATLSGILLFYSDALEAYCLFTPGPVFMLFCYTLLVFNGLKPFSKNLLIFVVAGCVTYWITMLITIFCSFMAFFSGILFAGLAATTVQHFSNQYLWPGKFRIIILFILAACSFMFAVVFLKYDFSRQVYKILPIVAYNKPVSFFIPSVFLWQVLVGGYWFNGLMQAKKNENSKADYYG
jgi:hypothetical protein